MYIVPLKNICYSLYLTLAKYTILHTEFYRERAQPGMIVIGSDSHTCSSGALGCLAIGLGGADVTLPLITGETWFKIPESVNIRLVGEPKPGIGGKDVILYILQQLKRNTVASERIVEFTGPGVKHLSSDARFAISNMTTVVPIHQFCIARADVETGIRWRDWRVCSR